MIVITKNIKKYQDNLKQKIEKIPNVLSINIILTSEKQSNESEKNERDLKLILKR